MALRGMSERERECDMGILRGAVGGRLTGGDAGVIALPLRAEERGSVEHIAG
jgi:hypothetical protein